MLPVLLYCMAREDRPDVKHSILFTVPKVATHKVSSLSDSFNLHSKKATTLWWHLQNTMEPDNEDHHLWDCQNLWS